MRKTELYNKFKGIFMEQMGLDLAEALTLSRHGNFRLSQELIGISMASPRLDLNREEHGEMAEFLDLIAKDK